MIFLVSVPTYTPIKGEEESPLLTSSLTLVVISCPDNDQLRCHIESWVSFNLYYSDKTKKKKFLKLFHLFWVFVWVYSVCGHHQNPEKCIRFPGAEVTCHCLLPNEYWENKALRKNSKRSYLLSNLFQSLKFFSFF